MEDTMKIVKLLDESGLPVKEISETIKNETKKQKGVFVPMLLGTLAASFLGSRLTGKGIIEQVKAQLEPVRIFDAISSFNFEMEKYYQNKPKFNGVYSRNEYLK